MMYLTLSKNSKGIRIYGTYTDGANQRWILEKVVNPADLFDEMLDIAKEEPHGVLFEVE